MFKLSSLLFILMVSIINISLYANTDSLRTRTATVEGSVMMGYAQYNVSSLQLAIDESLTQLIKNNIPAKIIDNFPNRPFYSLEITLIGNTDFSFGLKYAFISTGARISYADYSGEYKYDNLLNCSQYGINLRFATENMGSNFRLDYMVGGGIVSGILKSTESFDIAGQKQSQSYAADISCFYLEPGVRIYYIWNHFVTGVNATYNIDLKNNTTVKWYGLRAGFFLGARI
jgi:hypothetical protein